MEDTKVEGTKTKKRSRKVKEVPTERLSTIPSVLFPVILQIYGIQRKIFKCVFNQTILCHKIIKVQIHFVPNLNHVHVADLPLYEPVPGDPD